MIVARPMGAHERDVLGFESSRKERAISKCAEWVLRGPSTGRSGGDDREVWTPCAGVKGRWQERDDASEWERGNGRPDPCLEGDSGADWPEL